MTKNEFDKLTKIEQENEVVKALAWICVMEAINPYMESPTGEIETIKVVLGKIKDGEIKL